MPASTTAYTAAPRGDDRRPLDRPPGVGPAPRRATQSGDSGRRRWRLAWAVAALALVGGLVAALSAHGGGWQAAAFGFGPDLALLLGAGAGLAPGQLHPRAVPAYNAVHRIWGPVALGAAVAVGVLPSVWLAGALAWGLHVAVDRTCGYGLRTHDGFQRA